MNKYLEGTYVKITAEFRDSTSVLCDPTTIEITFKYPSGVLETLTYALGQIIKASTGIYYYVADTTDKHGFWAYEWVGSGVCDAHATGRFFVNESSIL